MINTKNKYIAILALLVGCSNPVFPQHDGYLAVRIVNNELGRLLKEYSSTTEKLAQDEVNVSASKECRSDDSMCRNQVKNRIAQKYSDRESRYNVIATVQRETARLITFADGTCATLPTDMCEAAKNDVVDNKHEIEKAWNEVSSWIK